MEGFLSDGIRDLIALAGIVLAIAGILVQLYEEHTKIPTQDCLKGA